MFQTTFIKVFDIFVLFGAWQMLLYRKELYEDSSEVLFHCSTKTITACGLERPEGE